MNDLVNFEQKMTSSDARIDLDLMRIFYDVFPYPGRFFLRSPSTAYHFFSRSEIVFGAENVKTQACEFHRKLREGNLSIAAHFELAKFNQLVRVRAKFGALRTCLVGCGTDEPLLFYLLDPSSDLTCIDLSKKSLKIAQNKLKIRLWREFLYGCLGVVRKFKKGNKNFFRNSPKFILGEACSILTAGSSKFGLIVCTGVLHHQSEPKKLFDAMVTSLEEGGVLRIMIYSKTGRRIERRIQRRHDSLWKRFSENRCHAPKFELMLRVLVYKLGLFFLKLRPIRRNVVQRFRYLGLKNSAIADAFLHPSDPGFSIEDLEKYRRDHFLKIDFCEAKSANFGWIMGVCEHSEVAWQQILECELRSDLISNVYVNFKKA